MAVPHIDKLTERASAHPSQQQLDRLTKAGPSAALFSTGPPTAPGSGPDGNQQQDPSQSQQVVQPQQASMSAGGSESVTSGGGMTLDYAELGASGNGNQLQSPAGGTAGASSWPTTGSGEPDQQQQPQEAVPPPQSPVAMEPWLPTQDWVAGWKSKLPLQTIMRLLQVLVPQVEKICIDRGLTDESEILRFLQVA